MGHCKHQWQERTAVLREVFWAGERRHHVFYVCSRCMKIDEVLAPPARLERTGTSNELVVMLPKAEEVAA
jgi:hypothetical protein